VKNGEILKFPSHNKSRVWFGAVGGREQGGYTYFIALTLMVLVCLVADYLFPSSLTKSKKKFSLNEKTQGGG
jgi:hypothetical protein